MDSRPTEPPVIEKLARAEVVKRIVQDREVMTHADLRDFKKGGERFSDIKPAILPTPASKPLFFRWKKTQPDTQSGAPVVPSSLESYEYYVGVRVNAGLARTREVLTDYRVYRELIPYISRADYFPQSGTLHVEGGIWRYRINSRIRFTEQGERWIRYEIIGGHFRGMMGEILLEPLGENGRDGTLVFLHGQSIANRFPPAFVIEQGAQVVFGFTAQRIRSYIESGRVPPDSQGAVPGLPGNPAESTGKPRSGGTKSDESELPQPRRRL